ARRWNGGGVAGFVDGRDGGIDDGNGHGCISLVTRPTRARLDDSQSVPRPAAQIHWISSRKSCPGKPPVAEGRAATRVAATCLKLLSGMGGMPGGRAAACWHGRLSAEASHEKLRAPSAGWSLSRGLLCSERDTLRACRPRLSWQYGPRHFKDPGRGS